MEIHPFINEINIKFSIKNIVLLNHRERIEIKILYLLMILTIGTRYALQLLGKARSLLLTANYTHDSGIYQYCIRRFWVSEWLLFNAKMCNFSAIWWREQVKFNEMVMITALFYANTLICIFIVLVHWSNISRVNMLFHSTHSSDYLLWLLNDACKAKKQQIPKYQKW